MSSSSGSSPNGSVSNGKPGRRSAKEDEDKEGYSQVSTQAATSTKCSTPQTSQSRFFKS